MSVLCLMIGGCQASVEWCIEMQHVYLYCEQYADILTSTLVY